MKTYNEKRDFSKTKEPKADPSERGNKEPIFVIQKHDATNLHYDFRLEIDNTLKSWSVPKGPSTDPSVKRMAIPTEDHPLAYANFEGVIPQGEYGGGTVMIWDTGTIESNKKDEKGNELSLEESYNLVEMKGGKMKGNWLLMKQDDSEADARRNPVNTQQKSVITGRTLKQIQKEESQNDA
jgi:DNA ligase D-like protein (predicted 3'-phosphoesterase)